MHRRRSLPALVLAIALIVIARCVEEERSPVSMSGVSCVLSAVIDGDSIRCADGREIRLLSIDAPEIAQSPWGQRARTELLARAPLRTPLTVEYDLERRDDFGRDLAYLYLADGAMLNEQLIARGYAVAFIISPNQRHAERMRSAEARARRASAGLWGEWGFSCRPVDFRHGGCG